MEWVCQICGYLHEDDEAPATCPVCGAPRTKFIERYEDDDSVEGNLRDDEEEADYYGEFE